MKHSEPLAFEILLPGHIIGHSKQKSVYVHVSYSEIELFHCTVHCTLYRRATCHVLTRVAKCIDADGGIFENVSLLSTILVLYSETALSQKPFGIGHMYMHIFFLLRMTATMTSQNIDFPHGTFCIIIQSVIFGIILVKLDVKVVPFCVTPLNFFLSLLKKSAYDGRANF
jgi:hypothetical protein